MAPSKTQKYLTVALLVACGAAGAYGTFGAGMQNGLFAAISKSTGPDVKPKNKYVPGGPMPFKTVYTGVPAIDQQLVVLITFFTFILDGPKTTAMSWTARYLMTQFVAGWALVSLEGLRRGNKRRIVSWVGTFGFVLQNITYTVTIPIYLIIHLFTSPLSGPSPPPAAQVSIATEDVATFPSALAISFILPAVMMALPVPQLLSPAAHYTWQAVWQIFPVTQAVYHFLAIRTSVSRAARARSLVTPDRIYRLILVLAVIPQTSLLVVALTPARLVPGALLQVLGTPRRVWDDIDFARAFVPFAPWATPTVRVGSRRLTGKGLPELTLVFLQYDLYCGGLALLVWASYVYAVARPEKRFLTSVVPRVLVWTVLGGPVAAATMLLWERDAAVRKEAEAAAVVAVERSEKKRK